MSVSHDFYMWLKDTKYKEFIKLHKGYYYTCFTPNIQIMWNSEIVKAVNVKNHLVGRSYSTMVLPLDEAEFKQYMLEFSYIEDEQCFIDTNLMIQGKNLCYIEKFHDIYTNGSYITRDVYLSNKLEDE